MILARRAALVATLALLAVPSRAADTVGVEIVQYGLYRADVVARQNMPGGVQHNVVGNICHIATTRDVPMKTGVHFGVRYRVTGPVAGERVLLKRVVRYPGVLTPPAGQASSRTESLVELKVGTTSYADYALEQPWEMAPGIWTFQFFDRDRMLAELSFTVGEDGSAAESSEPSCFQVSS